MAQESKVIQTEEELIQHVANLPPSPISVASYLSKRETLWIRRVKSPEKFSDVIDVLPPESGSFGKLD